MENKRLKNPYKTDIQKTRILQFKASRSNLMHSRMEF